MAKKHEKKMVELSKLTTYDNNPNMHPSEQVLALAKSIDTYGQYYPIVCDEDLKILCGHGKVLALQHLGHTSGEVTIIHGLTDKQKMKLVIEDNKIQSMSYVDYSKVEAIIKEIGEVDIIGFSTDYLETIINENVKDNMGVDLIAPVERKDNQKQVDDIPQKVKEDQDEERREFEDGMQTANTIICPHCGKEITL